MDTNLDDLATALYVACDDLLTEHPERVAPRRPGTFTARITDAEIITLAVMQALLGYTSERRWIRFAHTHLTTMFPTLPGQSGYNKRVRALATTMVWLGRILTAKTSIGDDNVWVVDSTPVECGRSRETALRSEAAGFAEYGYCASHTRYFWGLRLHLLTTLHGAPVGWALTGAKADERAVLTDILTGTPGLAEQIQTHAPTVIADKGYHGKDFEATLAGAGITLLRPTRMAHAQPGRLGRRCGGERHHA